MSQRFVGKADIDLEHKVDVSGKEAPLVQLPEDLKTTVEGMLEPRDVLQLYRTCRLFRDPAKSRDQRAIVLLQRALRGDRDFVVKVVLGDKEHKAEPGLLFEKGSEGMPVSARDFSGRVIQGSPYQGLIGSRNFLVLLKDLKPILEQNYKVAVEQFVEQLPQLRDRLYAPADQKSVVVQSSPVEEKKSEFVGFYEALFESLIQDRCVYECANLIRTELPARGTPLGLEARFKAAIISNLDQLKSIYVNEETGEYEEFDWRQSVDLQRAVEKSESKGQTSEPSDEFIRNEARVKASVLAMIDQYSGFTHYGISRETYQTIKDFQKNKMPKDIIKSGWHFDWEEFLCALCVYLNKRDEYITARNNREASQITGKHLSIYLNWILSYLSRYFTAIDVQILSSGSFDVRSDITSLKYSFRGTRLESAFFPLDADPTRRLGFNSIICFPPNFGTQMLPPGRLVVTSEKRLDYALGTGFSSDGKKSFLDLQEIHKEQLDNIIAFLRPFALQLQKEEQAQSAPTIRLSGSAAAD